MSSTLEGGRLPRMSPDVAANAARYLVAWEYGHTLSEIALKEGQAKSHVHRLVTAARRERDEAASADPVANPTEAEPKPPPRISRRTLLDRCWTLMERGRMIDFVVKSVWIEIVVAIHEDGDGHRLHLGEYGYLYQSRAELALLFGRPIEDLDSWLEILFRHGFLRSLEGGDIGLPIGRRLIPGEKIGGSRKPKRTPEPRLPLPFPVINGGRSLSPKNGVEGDDLGDDRGDGIGDLGDDLGDDEGDGAREVSTAAAAALDKENNILSSSSSNGSRAGASPSSSPKSSPKSSPSSSPKSSLDIAVEDLLAVAGLSKSPTALNIATIARWTKTETPFPVIKAAMEGQMARYPGETPGSMKWFDGSVMDAAKEYRISSAAPSTTPPTPTLSTADQAIKDLIQPFIDAWHEDRSCPFPPTLDSFKAAAADEKSKELAASWVAAWAIWDKAGRPGALKPPDFSWLALRRAAFEARMAEIEEEIATAPDPNAIH